MQIVSESSQNHSEITDFEWRISFLSDMRWKIRPQNYSSALIRRKWWILGNAILSRIGIPTKIGCEHMARIHRSAEDLFRVILGLPTLAIEIPLFHQLELIFEFKNTFSKNVKIGQKHAISFLNSVNNKYKGMQNDPPKQKRIVLSVF